MKKRSWEPFRSCLLNNTANPSISTQIVLDWLCQFVYFPRYITIETYARADFMVIIFSTGRDVAELFLARESKSFAHFGTFTAVGPNSNPNWTILLFDLKLLAPKLTGPMEFVGQWKKMTMYTLVHRFNNRWRWCRFASSIFKTIRDDVHKFEFKQFYSFIRWKILFFMLWVINFQYLWWLDHAFNLMGICIV